MRILYTSLLHFQKQVLPIIPSKWRKRLAFGFEALSLQPLVSLKQNARLQTSNRKTAETKIYRITHTQKLLTWFPRALQQLKLVQPHDKIAVDISTFGDRQVLVFAKQTTTGRAIPLYFEFIRYPLTEGSQNIFIISAMKEFVRLVRVSVCFVCDRGFACPSIIRSLNELKVQFIIRIKQGKHVVYQDCQRAVRNLQRRSCGVQVYGQRLRIIRSEHHTKWAEPWYLVTNDLTSATNTLIQVYYYRFEIEELFKDTKRLADLEYLLPMNDSTFTIVLWFIFLGFWMAWLVKAIRAAWLQQRQQAQRYHENCSLLHFWWETIAQERQRIVRHFLYTHYVSLQEV